jgi:hypothetical protein
MKSEVRLINTETNKVSVVLSAESWQEAKRLALWMSRYPDDSHYVVVVFEESFGPVSMSIVWKILSGGVFYLLVCWFARYDDFACDEVQFFGHRGTRALITVTKELFKRLKVAMVDFAIHKNVNHDAVLAIADEVLGGEKWFTK